MKTFLIATLVLGVCLTITSALPFFDNAWRDFRGHTGDAEAPARIGFAPQDQKVLYVSSSASDYDSTPSDGGGDTNPTAPTAGPGGNPTRGPSGVGGPILISEGNVGGMTAGIVVGLAVVVGIAVAVAIFIIKKKG